MPPPLMAIFFFTFSISVWPFDTAGTSVMIMLPTFMVILPSVNLKFINFRV